MLSCFTNIFLSHCRCNVNTFTCCHETHFFHCRCRCRHNWVQNPFYDDIIIMKILSLPLSGYHVRQPPQCERAVIVGVYSWRIFKTFSEDICPFHGANDTNVLDLRLIHIVRDWHRGGTRNGTGTIGNNEYWSPSLSWKSVNIFASYIGTHWCQSHSRLHSRTQSCTISTWYRLVPVPVPVPYIVNIPLYLVSYVPVTKKGLLIPSDAYLVASTNSTKRCWVQQVSSGQENCLRRKTKRKYQFIHHRQ